MPTWEGGLRGGVKGGGEQDRREERRRERRKGRRKEGRGGEGKEGRGETARMMYKGKFTYPHSCTGLYLSGNVSFLELFTLRAYEDKSLSVRNGLLKSLGALSVPPDPIPEAPP